MVRSAPSNHTEYRVEKRWFLKVHQRLLKSGGCQVGLITDIYLGNAKFKKEAIESGSIKRKGRPHLDLLEERRSRWVWKGEYNVYTKRCGLRQMEVGSQKQSPRSKDRGHKVWGVFGEHWPILFSSYGSPCSITLYPLSPLSPPMLYLTMTLTSSLSPNCLLRIATKLLHVPCIYQWLVSLFPMALFLFLQKRDCLSVLSLPHNT